MYCKNCGKESIGTEKFCANCGASFSTSANRPIHDQPPSSPISKVPSKKINAKQVLWTIVILGFVGYRIYSGLDSSSIDTNNSGLASFDSGNKQQAITQFQEASNNAVSNNTKIQTLKNLGYVYATEGQNDQAMSSFQSALKLTAQNSFDYYLISAEIAVLGGKPEEASIDYNKAYQMNPDDFKVNNGLSLFYLNLDGSSPAYEDYPKALIYAQKADNLNNSETTKENLGIAYFANKNYDKSISLLSQLDLSQHPYINLWLGLAYGVKGDVSDAKTYLQKAVDLGIKVPQAVTDYLNTH